MSREKTRKEISFDLSVDHAKCFVYVNGTLIAMLHADISQPNYTGGKKEDTLFVMCDTCKQEENHKVVSKPLAYITGFNSLAFGPLKLD